MNLSKGLYSLVFLFLAGWSSAQSPASFSLEEAIDYAIDKSLDLQTAEQDILYAKQQIRDTRAIGLPQLSGKVEYNYNANLPVQYLPDFISPIVVGTLEGYQLVPQGTLENLPEGEPQPAQFGIANSLTAGATLSQLIFDGSYFVGLKAARSVAELSRKQKTLTAHEIPYTIKKAYLAVLLAEENLGILDKNLENLQNMRDETQAFFESGLVEQLDVDRLDLSLANLQSERGMVERQTQLAYNVLKFQMNYPLEESIVLKDELESLMQAPSQDDLEGEASASKRPELEVLRLNRDLMDLNMKRYKAGYLPNLSGFLAHQYQLQRNNLFDSDEGKFNPITVIGLQLNVPIFDGFKKDANIQMAKIDATKVDIQIKQFTLATELEIRNARAMYLNASERLDNQKKNLALAERILETTRLKYREGVGSSTEISTAEQELYRTQANYMNAIYDLVIAKTDLDKALGNPLK